MTNRRWMRTKLITAVVLVLGLLSGCQGELGDIAEEPLEDGALQAVSGTSVDLLQQIELEEEQTDPSRTEGLTRSTPDQEGLFALEESGLLLGLRSDGDDLHTSSPVYDTIWISMEKGRPTLQLFSQALVLPSISDQGVETLRSYMHHTEEDVISYIRYGQGGNNSEESSLLIEERTGEHARITEQVMYVGELGVSLSRSGSFWAGNAPANIWGSQMFEVAQLNTNVGYTYDDFYDRGSTSLQDVIGELAYNTMAAELMQRWEAEKDATSDRGYLDVDGFQWGIQHEAGEWRLSLYGLYSIQGGNVALYEQQIAASSFVPASERGGELDWQLLQQSYPDAHDASLSPDGRWAVILLPDALVLSILEEDRFSSPLQTWPIRSHAHIVMSRWMTDTVRDIWQERLEELHELSDNGDPS